MLIECMGHTVAHSIIIVQNALVNEGNVRILLLYNCIKFNVIPNKLDAFGMNWVVCHDQ